MASQNCQLTMAVRPILSPETVAQLSKPTSTEVFQVMENNIVGCWEPTFRTVWCKCYYKSENLGRLLVSAMISGYFLRNADNE